MLASGSFIAGVGLLLATLLALLFRHPNAPRWTRPEIVAMLIGVPLSGIICFGVGYVAYGLSQLAKGAGDPRELLVLAGVVIALVVVWMGLGIRRRLRAYGLVTAGTAPNVHQLNELRPATDEAPPPSTPRPRPPRLRKAA
jgi:heme A synthase